MNAYRHRVLPYRNGHYFRNRELEAIKWWVNSFLACMQTHVLIRLGSHSETFMILILHRFPDVSWSESPSGSYCFTWHDWKGLYFSRLTESISQSPSLAAVLYLVNSQPGFLYLGISLSGLPLYHSNTSLVPGYQAFTRLHLFRNWMVPIRHTSLCPHAADLPLPGPAPRVGLAAHYTTAWASCWRLCPEKP